MVEVVFEKLESQTESLIELCQQLKNENKQLIQKQALLVAEKNQLIEVNLVAQQQMEKLLSKLKQMAKTDGK